ncbi:hypothetical protein QJS10_CPB14g00888 [Acorus calamus]|uniref:Uncharacterized protein n=1 Tax=Acorus calamus TaxID=4465 RepID=A0AAV9DCR0_ACOCL|nr:hypothetical protein QJS10_CPB14g00888 [Acorus calamus]
MGGEGQMEGLGSAKRLSKWARVGKAGGEKWKSMSGVESMEDDAEEEFDKKSEVHDDDEYEDEEDAEEEEDKDDD